jgi:outer membrane protein TolC
MKSILNHRTLHLATLVFIGLGRLSAQENIALEPTAAEQQILEDYRREASGSASANRTFAKTRDEKIPEDFSPWWIRGQRNTLGDASQAQRLSVDELYVRALRHSSQIRVFSDLPLIRETGIQEAQGAFDTNAYLQGKFDRANDPVGNTLTTGGASRFKQDEWSFEAGVRKKVITGAEINISQTLSRTDNNSIYFLPNPQSNAKLSVSVVQPLLKGAGVGYNRSIMRIAKLDSDIAMQEFIRQSESHLLEITRTYWALYAARVTYLQKSRLVDDTARVTDELRARQKVDAGKSQLFRAESALASRRSDLVRAESAVRNAQDRLKALTSDPTLLHDPNIEIIPRDRLVLTKSAFDGEAAAHAALESRPEINQAFLQLRAATVREQMSRNELLPELNLVLQGSLGGLDDGDYGGAYGREYSTGSPGWGAGFVLSFPLENQIARARLERRRLELRQQMDQLRTTIDTVLLEVKISAREVATAYRETQAKYSAVKAFTEDIETLEARRSLQAVNEENQMAGYLDTMLDTQDRRAQAEEEFIRAGANYQIAIVNLERARGRLLNYSSIEIVRDRDEKKLPQLHLEKGARDGKSVSSGK